MFGDNCHGTNVAFITNITVGDYTAHYLILFSEADWVFTCRNTLCFLDWVYID